MAKNLVIVESPAKAKTIEKFLGSDFKVMSSYGHIRDLKKKDFSIDIENDFEPVYEIPEDKRKVVSELKAAANKAETVWLASDEDREGEAISWHLYHALDLEGKDTKRIVFHEITKTAIQEAVKNPRSIDNNLVDAQQARRVLDRIVGFELSPVLWRKIKPALSAGRVQSVSVRLIVEREREIQNFESEAAYRIIAIFSKEGDDGQMHEIKAEYNKRLKTKEEALQLLESLKSSTFTVEDVNTRPAKKSPAPPFTTSTLQQEASRKLGFSVAQTMRVAQSLYESGRITYMRTDSVNLSGLAINTAKAEIVEQYGEKYWQVRQYSTKSKGAQEAHEAIRPTFINEHEAGATQQEKRLYNLIWKRTVASQMANAELERTTATIGISGAEGKFIANGEVIKFDGFLRVYLEGTDDEDTESDEGLLPPMKADDLLDMMNITATERFTQRPARYTEASLVRKMEELGIGRPSTYAPTISTIQNREYVEKRTVEGTKREFNILKLEKGKISDKTKTETVGYDKNKLVPTDIGMVVNDFLVEFFPNVVDYHFTADVEKDFDEIAMGNKQWNELIKEFYAGFHPVVEETMEMRMEHKAGERVLGTDPKTGRQVSVKIGRYGPLAQIGVPDEEEKPLFAALQKTQSIETITLEEALKLFELPRNLGLFRDKDMTVAIGRFGPYIRHNNKFVSLPKEYDPMEVTAEEAIALIEEKERKDREKIIKTFDEEPGLQVLNGRYGPYIAFEKKNYKIPKSQKPDELTLEECKKIIEGSQKDGAKKTTRKSAVKTTKTTAAKKTTTKKTTTKKSDDKK